MVTTKKIINSNINYPVDPELVFLIIYNKNIILSDYDYLMRTYKHIHTAHACTNTCTHMRAQLKDKFIIHKS